MVAAYVDLAVVVAVARLRHRRLCGEASSSPARGDAGGRTRTDTTADATTSTSTSHTRTGCCTRGLEAVARGGD
jgi:hypothetical protein